MANLQIEKILEGASGVRKEGSAWLFSDETEAHAFVALGNEVLQVQKLQRIEIKNGALAMTTHKGEGFFFPPEQLVGFKFGGADHKLGGRSQAGFR